MLNGVCLVALAAAAVAQFAHPYLRADIDTYTCAIVTSLATSTSTAEPLSVHERFPHAVLIGGKCGGSIISAKWVLTAAQCSRHINFLKGYTVTAGASESLDITGTTVVAKKIYIHPFFSIGPFWVNARRFGIKQISARWDFMLVELESPLRLDGVNMAAVVLDGEPFVPENLTVAYAGYGAKRISSHMRKSMRVREMQTVSDAQCSSKLLQYNAEDMVCAMGIADSKDSTCNGDRGSGLVTNSPDSLRRLVGVVSWAEDDAHTCSPDATVVFARVASARPWIKQITGLATAWL